MYSETKDLIVEFKIVMSLLPGSKTADVSLLPAFAATQARERKIITKSLSHKTVNKILQAYPEPGFEPMVSRRAVGY